MKYNIIEHWQNRANTGTEILTTTDNKKVAIELVCALVQNINRNGLGKDFPNPAGEFRVFVFTEDNRQVTKPDDVLFHINTKQGETVGDTLVATIAKSSKDAQISEYRRAFQIKPAKWDFVYDEGFPDTAGQNEMGVISDGEHYLFYHAYAEEEGQPEICHIYSSLNMDEDTEECSYPWTAENDSILLECLNNLENETDFCGEGSPIRTLKFNN